MTPEPATLPEFLLARLAEDEAAVYAADSDGEYRIAWVRITQPNGGLHYATVASDHRNGEWCADGVNLRGAQRAMQDPAVVFDARRVLAECTAKRRIIALHIAEDWEDVEGTLRCSTCCYPDAGHWADREAGPWPCDHLRILAAPYRDHPDFQPSWVLEGS